MAFRLRPILKSIDKIIAANGDRHFGETKPHPHPRRQSQKMTPSNALDGFVLLLEMVRVGLFAIYT
jgi:hypothetical protein